MAAVDEDFETWLSLKLRELKTDEGVFGHYIKGILEGEENLDEKTEALEGILVEITENDIPLHSREIIERWKKFQSNKATNHVYTSEIVENVEEKLVKLLESNALPTIVQKQYTEEERKIREAILAQYSQTSDQESDPDDTCCEVKENGLVKNTNVALVQQAEREKREKAKIDSQKKKEKDKEDREKQKQLQQEKKEKRKTQKGERRR
uniref:Coiled-coil domain-containing protein 43 n=1 Tax=Clastoptera arizonana TaxID=38151 RepID=A0A1B6DHY5_9HEMI